MISKSAIVNELLAYVTFYRNRSDLEALRRVVLSTDVSEAKKLLITEFPETSDNP
jgi:hypothetical protein